MKRAFIFDFWARGVMLAQGQTPHLAEMARAIDKWVASSCATADLATSFRFVSYEVVSASGKALGRGNAEEAAELVVANLPPGCGPAVSGTAEDMDGAEPSATPDCGGM